MSENAAATTLGGISAEAAQADQIAAAAAAKRAAGIVEFELNDHDGKTHKYLVTLHGTEEGERILWQLITLGGEPLGALCQGAAGKLIAEGGSLGDVLDGGAAEMLAEIDFAGLGRQVSNAVARSNMPALTKAIFKFAHRDGKPLRDPAVYNAAYRANYWELLQAQWEIVRANRFLPF